MDAMIVMKRGLGRPASGPIAAVLSPRYDSPSNLERHGAGTVSEGRYNPSSKGWGVAALIIALAIVANLTAWSIHKATYLKPDKASAPAGQER
jgi:hypothetical protein